MKSRDPLRDYFASDKTRFEPQREFQREFLQLLAKRIRRAKQLQILYIVLLSIATAVLAVAALRYFYGEGVLDYFTSLKQHLTIDVQISPLMTLQLSVIAIMLVGYFMLINRNRLKKLKEELANNSNEQ